jgi:hypothetical protein
MCVFGTTVAKSIIASVLEADKRINLADCRIKSRIHGNAVGCQHYRFVDPSNIGNYTTHLRPTNGNWIKYQLVALH